MDEFVVVRDNVHMKMRTIFSVLAVVMVATACPPGEKTPSGAAPPKAGATLASTFVVIERCGNRYNGICQISIVRQGCADLVNLQRRDECHEGQIEDTFIGPKIAMRAMAHKWLVVRGLR